MVETYAIALFPDLKKEIVEDKVHTHYTHWPYIYVCVTFIARDKRVKSQPQVNINGEY